MIICGIALFNSLQEDYELFNYDAEVKKAAVKILRSYERKLSNFGTTIECDVEMTWICFNLVTS